MQIPHIGQNLSPNHRMFLAETVGTFVVVVLATASVVIDARYGNKIGLWFVALCPAVAVAAMVYAFAKTSMAHFNPAVTIGFLISRHLSRGLLVLYLSSQALGALLGSLFVKYAIGSQAHLGANAPNYSFPIPLIFFIEVLATCFLMGTILIVVHTKGLCRLGGVVIGAVVGLDIFFLSFISGASMNPARSLAPAILSGYVGNLWLYFSATFIGSGISAFIYRRIFPL